MTMYTFEIVGICRCDGTPCQKEMIVSLAGDDEETVRRQIIDNIFNGSHGSHTVKSIRCVMATPLDEDAMDWRENHYSDDSYGDYDPE
jgi:hypothetical protein